MRKLGVDGGNKDYLKYADQLRCLQVRGRFIFQKLDSFDKVRAFLASAPFFIKDQATLDILTDYVMECIDGAPSVEVEVKGKGKSKKAKSEAHRVGDKRAHVLLSSAASASTVGAPPIKAKALTLTSTPNPAPAKAKPQKCPKPANSRSPRVSGKCKHVLLSSTASAIIVDAPAASAPSSVGPADKASKRRKRHDPLAQRLCAAVKACNLAGVRELLESGAGPDAIDEKDEEHSSALLLAAKHPHLDVCRLLLSKGASCNLANDVGDTPLIAAVQWVEKTHKRHADLHGALIRLLLDNGANPNCRVKYDFMETPLCCAVQWFNKEFDILPLELLLKHPSTNVNYGDGHAGSTPLSYAVYYGLPDCVLELRSHGAKPRKSDRLGQSPFDLAMDKGDEEIIEALAQAVGRSGNGEDEKERARKVVGDE